MRDALASRLEQLSYYRHLSLVGGEERPVCAYRIVDIRGTRYHVLSRLLDAGLDYTNRTNFLAHHLVLTAEEAAQLSSPPLLFLHWDGWQTRWEGDPRMLDGESWGNLTTINSTSTIPAHTWARLTGQGVNGFGLLDLPGAAWLQTDSLSETDLLLLLAESLTLLALRERRTSPALTTWQVIFTTAYQEQDSPNDFRWRCIQSGTSPGRTGGGQSVVSFLQVRPRQHTEEEQRFAEGGPTPVSMVQRPQDREARDGDSVRFQAEAQGIPYPTYEWFLDGVLIAGQTGPQCVIDRVEAAKSQPRQFRVIVRAANGYGTVEATARLVVLPNLRIASPAPAPAARRKVEPASPAPSLAPPSPPPRLDVLMLVQNILDAWTKGRRQAAEPWLQELRRRQSELASLPDPILENFLNDSKEANQEELIRMLGSERARRPKRMSKPLVAIGVVLMIAMISLGAWQGKKYWQAKDTKTPDTATTAQQGNTNSGTNNAKRASKNGKKREPALRSTVPAESPPEGSPKTTPTPNTDVRQSNGTSYFLLAGKSPQFPNSLTKLLDQLLPAGAPSFTATNLEFRTEDLNLWQEQQKSKAFEKPRSKANSLEFWDPEQPAWKAIFERHAPATPIHLHAFPVDDSKVVFGRNQVDGREETFFRLVFVPETTSKLPERNAQWKDSRLTLIKEQSNN